MHTSFPRGPEAALVTFGSLSIGGGDPSAMARLLSQPKRVALLLYVLISQRGGAVSRDQIVGVFWPESDAVRSRNALRQALSFLRLCLGDRAIINVGAQGLAVAESVTCDAVHFETLLDTNRKEEALRLYGGEFLPGFYLGVGSLEFGAWLDARRANYARRAAKAAWDLSAEGETAGDLLAAAFWGKRALALSPFSESEVQRLLRLLVRVGDFAGALRAFHGLQTSLETEFGSQPSVETARLAADIAERLRAEGTNVPALLGTRRTGADRRRGDRRSNLGPWKGVERRGRGDRRGGERRSGVDRRTVRTAESTASAPVGTGH